MKKIALQVAIAAIPLILGVLTALSAEFVVKPGDQGVVPYFMMVNVANPDGIDNDTSKHLRYGAQCGVESGTMVEVLRVTDAKALMRFSGIGRAANRTCPNGTLVFESFDFFAKMKVLIDDKAIIVELLKQPLTN